MNIILASGSKRRSSMLSSCGIRHEVVVSDVRENTKGRYPSRLAMINACMKARKVAEGTGSGFVIGADTVVLLGKKIIGKPVNAAHAKKMLKAMSGKKIFVYTGLCVVDAKKKRSILDYEKSEVKVRKIKPSNIPRYFKLLAPYDKAGGFSIEGVGSFLFDDIKGSYFNVLGLPTAKLKDMFKRLGVDLLRFVKRES